MSENVRNKTQLAIVNKATFGLKRGIELPKQIYHYVKCLNMMTRKVKEDEAGIQYSCGCKIEDCCIKNLEDINIIRKFITVIKEYKFVIINCEVDPVNQTDVHDDSKKKIDAIKLFKRRLDMLAQTEDGRIVIFEFKCGYKTLLIDDPKNKTQFEEHKAQCLLYMHLWNSGNNAQIYGECIFSYLIYLDIDGGTWIMIKPKEIVMEEEKEKEKDKEQDNMGVD